MLENNEGATELSPETLAALIEFYKEQAERDEADESGNYDTLNVAEDWQLSQFWYDEETIATINKIVTKTVEPGGKIALISCPTLYKPLKNQTKKNYEIMLFEYDRRFAAIGADFVLYDYKFPLLVPNDRMSYYDLVIADPPFLSEECLTKVTDTMKYLCKQKMILCTGVVMCDLAKSLIDVERSSFEPKHKKNLANEFCCLSNFDVDSLL